MPPVEGISWGSAFLFLHSIIAAVPNRLNTETQNDAIKKHVFLSLFTPHQVCSPSWQQEGSSQSQGNYDLVMGSWSGERKFLSKSQRIGSMNCFWWDDLCYLSPNQSLWRGTVANHWLVGSEAVPFLNWGEGRRLDELHGVSVWVWRDTLKTVSASVGRDR